MKKNFFKLVVLFWGLTSLAHAYEFTVDFKNGFYWASLPIGINKFVTNPIDGPDLAQMVDDSENSWEGAVGRELWNFNSGWIVSNTYSGNYIRWSDNFAAETGYDPTGTLAITIRYTSGPYMTRTEIILNRDLIGTDNSLAKKTILHEMGHTLGLDHSFQPAIMGAYAGSISTLQWDDVQGASAIVDETLYRQQTGFISPLAKQTTTEEYATCGSVSMIGAGSGDDKDGQGGAGGFGISLMLGLLLASLGATFSKRQV